MKNDISAHSKPWNRETNIFTDCALRITCKTTMELAMLKCFRLQLPFSYRDIFLYNDLKFLGITLSF